MQDGPIVYLGQYAASLSSWDEHSELFIEAESMYSFVIIFQAFDIKNRRLSSRRDVTNLYYTSYVASRVRSYHDVIRFLRYVVT